MRFDAGAPFKIMSTEPPSSAKTSRTQAPGSITVKPTKTVEVTSLLKGLGHTILGYFERLDDFPAV